MQSFICRYPRFHRFEKLSKLVEHDPELQSKNKNPMAAIEDEKKEHEKKKDLDLHGASDRMLLPGHQLQLAN